MRLVGPADGNNRRSRAYRPNCPSNREVESNGHVFRTSPPSERSFYDRQHRCSIFMTPSPPKSCLLKRRGGVSSPGDRGRGRTSGATTSPRGNFPSVGKRYVLGSTYTHGIHYACHVLKKNERCLVRFRLCSKLRLSLESMVGTFALNLGT